ncbi:hypothetical protein AB0B28_08125 [Glycomyces sp. NPDC046736]|uniref:phage tail protein n=1 Tax=Glycomyces sp. NPDC046736 TaxID=3155615 RepID=UPI0033FC5AA2
MALNLGKLFTVLDAKNDGLKKGLKDSRRDMAEFHRDANGRLRDMRGKFISEGEAAGKGYGDGFKRKAETDVDGAMRDANGRLRDARGRFIKSGEDHGERYGDGFRRRARMGLRQFLNETEDHLGALRSSFGNLFAHISNSARRVALPAVLAIIATAAAGAASSLGPLITLVGTLATAVGGMAVAAPVFLGGLVAAVATLKIGFKGLGDAIAGDEEALEKLPGPAREVVAAVRDMQPAWEAVTKSVQSAMWKGVGDQLTVIGDKVLPKLKGGLTGVAEGFNTLIVEALKAAGSKEAMAGLDAVLANTQKGLEAWAGGMDGWIRGLGTLLEETSPLLADAGTWAAQLGDRFQNWATKAQESGRITELLAVMKDTLSTLGSIVGNLGSIFSSVFGAANDAGGSLLHTIESVTGQFADWLKTAEGAEALQTFFESLAEVGAAATPVIMALASVIATQLAPKIGDIATNIGPQLTTVITRIGDVIEGLDIAGLASSFGDFLSVVSTLLIPLGGVINFLIMISPVLLPILAGVAAGVAVFKTLQLVMVILTVAQWAWNYALFASPITWIILAIVALVAIIVLLATHWDTVAAMMGIAWDWIVEKFEQGKALVSLIAQQIWEWITQQFETGKAAVMLIVRVIVDYFNQKINEAKLIFAWFGTLASKIGGWFQGVYNAAKDKLNSLVEWVGGIPDKITSALGDLGSLLWNAGKDIVNGLIDGVKSMWSSVESTFSDLTAKIPDWKGPESVDRTILRGPAQTIIDGFADDLWARRGVIAGVLGAMTSELALIVGGTETGGAELTLPAPPGGQGEPVTRLSDEDRELLRELADVRARLDIRTNGRTRSDEDRDNSLVVT